MADRARRAFMMVALDLPDHCPESEALRYVSVAIRLWHRANGYTASDPMGRLDENSVSVKLQRVKNG